MRCPQCKTHLDYNTIDDTSSIEKRAYLCGYCGIRYERHILRNSIGLIKADTLYEMNNGMYMKAWD